MTPADERRLDERLREDDAALATFLDYCQLETDLFFQVRATLAGRRFLADLQLDDRSPVAPALVPRLLELDPGGSYYSGGQELLRGWDYSMPADSPAAAYFNVVWRQVLALTFHDDLPEDALSRLGRRHSQRINTIVTDIVRASWPASGEDDPSGHRRIDPGVKPLISMSAEVRAATNNLRDFMFERVYLREDRRPEVQEAQQLVCWLFDYYCAHPAELPRGWSVPTDPIDRQAVDFISGMTDRYALRTAADLGCPAATAPVWERRLA